MSRKINIAIDGFSSTGKSTLARDLARQLGYRYIDSGAMYRAVTLYALRNGIINKGELSKEKLINAIPEISVGFEWNEHVGAFQVSLNGEIVEPDIRKMEVARFVSPVAAISEVRRFLVSQQQEMADHKGIVMDGRDIGTVVLPNAELKMFVTASQEIRTDRRFRELSERGLELTREEVAENLRKRDHIDSTRADSPLVQADDARLLDNSEMSMQEQLALALSWVEELTAQNQES